MSYGVNIINQVRYATIYVDKIFKGSSPGDLSIEQPTEFELVVNMKTAKSLGMTISNSISVRAGKVIE